MLKRIVIALSVLGLSSGLAHADSTDKQTNLVALTSAIKNTSVKLPVTFNIPNPEDQKYYLYKTGPKGDTLYTVYIDSSADCHGAKYCNVGSLKAQKKARPQMLHDINKQLITETLPFGHGTAYYTPAHPMADYWPAILQWQGTNTLYTLSWHDKMEASTMLEMAGSLKLNKSKNAGL